jgi:hypothetical protein
LVRLSWKLYYISLHFSTGNEWEKGGKRWKRRRGEARKRRKNKMMNDE